MNYFILMRLLDYDSFDDFCLVPASSEELPSSRLKKENIALKAKIEAMEKQMASVQRQVKLRNEQDQQLRDNIALARREVRIFLCWQYYTMLT